MKVTVFRQTSLHLWIDNTLAHSISYEKWHNTSGATGYHSADVPSLLFLLLFTSTTCLRIFFHKFHDELLKEQFKTGNQF